MCFHFKRPDTIREGVTKTQILLLTKRGEEGSAENQIANFIFIFSETT
jgi:hypothetical protein